MEIEWMDSFLKRLTGAITRPIDQERKILIFSPGGSIHTCFMRYALHIFFLDAQFNILKACPGVMPWRVVTAPRNTRYVAESAANLAFDEVQLTLENING